MGKPENTLSKTESSLSKSDVFVELPLIRLQRSEDGEYFNLHPGLYNNLNNIYGRVVGVHSIYSVVKEFRGCFKGKFWRSIVLLFHLVAIYLPVLKSLVHMYEMWQMNRLWLTQIYLYRWYVPDLIRLANDIETNPGPAVVDKTPYSSSNIFSSLSNRQFF